jgi:hypothetical protein
MAEFKRLSDVEVVAEPTESANVLIEEDGIIKKAPKTAVGGAGGGETPDMVITINGNLGSEDIKSQLSITGGSLSAIANKLQAENNPIVKIRHVQGVNGDYHHYINEFDASVTTYGESYWFAAIISSPTGPSIYKVGFGINSDNNFIWASANSIS